MYLEISRQQIFEKILYVKCEPSCKNRMRNVSGKSYIKNQNTFYVA